MLSSYYCDARLNSLIRGLGWMLPEENSHGIYVYQELLNYEQRVDTACGIIISKQA